MDLEHGQMGLWIACLVSFSTALLSLFGVYRVLTRNFVTKLELSAEFLKFENKIGAQITETRHMLRNELHEVTLKFENKLDTMSETQGRIKETLARIEAVIEVRMSKLKELEDDERR